MSPPLNALLVAGGQHHDFDFVRRRLLERMAENPAVGTTVRNDFSDIEALTVADLLVSYTCNVRPTVAQELALRRFVSQGGRWLALHATNAMLGARADGAEVATSGWSRFFDLLGTKFITHSAICEFDVRAAEGAAHSVLGDIRKFRTRDEIYLVERTAPIDVLLETTYAGPTTGVPGHWDDERPQPVLYLRHLGRGSVLYLTLGHASVRGDEQTTMEDPAAVERCSWDVPEFAEILHRAFEWAGV